jgi:isopentenyldiphosphate isomerase/intracellular septation protein A
MNTRQMLLKMLPGLIPLFVFIIADEIWGTQTGLVVALVVGVAEVMYVWVKEKRIDKFILFDTFLLVAMGGISIVLDNDIFFKIKPGIIGVILSVLLGISAFTPRNFLLAMSQRYTKGLTFSDEQYKKMTQSIKALFFIFSIHTLLVFYAAWFLSKEAWLFISGGLFYILVGAYFLFEFLKLKWQQKKLAGQEWFPLVDESGKVIGKAPRSVCHSNKELMHPVVHLHVFNAKGELYLQKRPAFKTIQPNKWDTAVGGHIALGEAVEDALKRETFEEIALKDFTPQFLVKYVWKSEVETELVFVFVTQYDGKLEYNTTELADGKFWSLSAIKKDLGKNIFTPNFEHEYNLIVKRLHKK